MKRDKKKTFRNLIVFIAIILFTFYIIFKDQDITDFAEALKNIDIKFIIVGIVCMAMYFVCDAINIGTSLKKLGEKSTFIKNVKYSLIGFFFSAITPAASGGQPMQIYYMKKENISVANSTLTFLINLSCMQIVTISLALVSLIFNLDKMNGVLISCFILGIALNLTALTLLIISIYSRRMTNGLIKLTEKFLKFIKVKNLEEKTEKIEKELTKYQESAKYIKSNIKLIVRILLMTYLQFLFYYSTTYCVYCAFGLSQYNILQIISLQAILYGTVSGIPSPGAVGVSEGGFIELFKNVYAKEQISSAMLLNRGVNFYLYVIISAILVTICSVKDDKKIQLEEKNEEKKEQIE